MARLAYIETPFAPEAMPFALRRCALRPHSTPFREKVRITKIAALIFARSTVFREKSSKS